MLAWRHAAFSHGVAVAGYRDQPEEVITQLPAGRSWASEVAEQEPALQLSGTKIWRLLEYRICAQI